MLIIKQTSMKRLSKIPSQTLEKVLLITIICLLLLPIALIVIGMMSFTIEEFLRGI